MSPKQASNRISVLRRRVVILENQLGAADALIALYQRRAQELNKKLAAYRGLRP